jgi:hypothetical protein
MTNALYALEGKVLETKKADDKPSEANLKKVESTASPLPNNKFEAYRIKARSYPLSFVVCLGGVMLFISWISFI